MKAYGLRKVEGGATFWAMDDGSEPLPRWVPEEEAGQNPWACLDTQDEILKWKDLLHKEGVDESMDVVEFQGLWVPQSYPMVEVHDEP